MDTKPRIAHTLLPSLMLAASAAFPAGASAQTAPPFKAAPLSAAMAEVRRSPLYATSSVERLSIIGMASVAAPHVGDRLARDATEGPSFHRVFWPTLGGVLLSEFAFLNAVLDDERNLSGEVFGMAIMVVGPPAVARAMGARFIPGLLGSAAGLGIGFGLIGLGVVELDDSRVLAIPITHALLTTVISRL